MTSYSGIMWCIGFATRLRWGLRGAATTKHQRKHLLVTVVLQMQDLSHGCSASQASCMVLACQNTTGQRRGYYVGVGEVPAMTDLCRWHSCCSVATSRWRCGCSHGRPAAGPLASLLAPATPPQCPQSPVTGVWQENTQKGMYKTLCLCLGLF